MLLKIGDFVVSLFGWCQHDHLMFGRGADGQRVFICGDCEREFPMPKAVTDAR